MEEDKIDEFMGMPIPKGDMLDVTKKNVKWFEGQTPEKKLKIERYWWIFMLFLAAVIAFAAGFGIGFERSCSVVQAETQVLCNEFICEHYIDCSSSVEAVEMPFEQDDLIEYHDKPEKREDSSDNPGAGIEV